MNPQAPMSLSDFFRTIGSSFVPKTNTLPNGGGSYQSPTPNMSTGQNRSVVPFPSRVPPVTAPTNTPPVIKPPASNTPIFKGPASGPAGATGATGATVPVPTALDPKYINPITKQPYTASEYADAMAKRAGGGVVPGYAGDALNSGNLSAEELAKKAREINNSRNDVATGATDPYGIGSKSGIQYTPSELKAIESAYAGVFDPALNDVMGKLDTKQKQDATDATAKIAATKTQADFQNDLLKMDQQFKYNLALERDKASHTGGVDLSGLSLGDYATTTSSGNKYIDLSTVTDKKEKHVIENAARASGVPVLTDTNVQKMNAIEDTRNNLDNIKAQFDKIGYSGGTTKALGGLGFGASNRIADFFGDTNVGSFKAWRTAAINSIQALAGGTGSGLRINQAEINAAMENDIPNISDTIAVGDAKLGVLHKQLNSWEKTLLQGNTSKNVNNNSSSSSIVTAPDGTKVEIID